MQPGKPVANEPSRLLCLCFRNDSLAAYIAFSRWRDLRQVGGTTEKPVPAGSTISTVQMDGRPRYWTRRGSPKRDVQFVHRRRVAFAAAKRSALSTLPITCIASETCGAWSTTFSTTQAEVTRRIVAALALE